MVVDVGVNFIQLFHFKASYIASSHRVERILVEVVVRSLDFVHLLALLSVVR